MKTKTTAILMMFCAAMLLAAPSLFAEQVEFNYNGRVKVQGQPFTGDGQFKFTLISRNKQVTYWANDGVTLDGGEPIANVTVPVTEGFFSVNIGDTETTGTMAALNPSLFNIGDRIFLRTWFSDGVHGFQQLHPDQQVVNPALLGQQSGDADYTIYVNGATGDDANSGLTTGTAKKTIQAAVDLVPARIKINITIDIADGVYREKVILSGITAAPDKALTLLGDEDWTTASPSDPTVRLTGSDAGADAVAVRDSAVVMQSCTNVRLQGLLFTNTTYYKTGFFNSAFSMVNCKILGLITDDIGVYVGQNSNGSIIGCLAINNTAGFHFLSATVTIRDTIARNNPLFGFKLMHSYVWSYNTEATGSSEPTSGWGIYLDAGSSILMFESANLSNNTFGMYVIEQSSANFRGGYSGQVNNNSLYGIRANWMSFISNSNFNSFSGNGSNTLGTNGSLIFN